MKALIELVLGKKDAIPVSANSTLPDSSIEYAANKLRRKLAEKRLRNGKPALQHGTHG